MANDHCCTNDKRNESGKDLSFFNFPSNMSQRSQWIASVKGDEGPLLFLLKSGKHISHSHNNEII